MWFDQSVPVLAVADTTRPILLIAFIVGLFALAGLGVFLGRKHVAAQNARALSDDTGLAKGAVKGGDGTFSTDWLAEAREDVDDTPRQSWADVLTLQGVGEVADAGASPFGATTVAEDPALGYGTPAPQVPGAYEAPTYPVEATAPEPTFETHTFETSTFDAPTYETPTFEAPVTETPTFEAPVYEAPVYPAEPTYETPTYETPTFTEPATTVAAEPAVPVYEAPQSAPVYEAAPEPLPVPPTGPTAPAAPATPGEEYATFFGATPPPPPPPVEPFNIWAPDADDH